MPTQARGKSAAELVDLYLNHTPFKQLFEAPAPFGVPEETRFEHGHILGGTGAGKTQLLQRMIHADLVSAATDGRSVVVIDSQGDLISKLVRLDLFDPRHDHSLADRLVLIDPSDIEYQRAIRDQVELANFLMEVLTSDRERADQKANFLNFVLASKYPSAAVLAGMGANLLVGIAKRRAAQTVPANRDLYWAMNQNPTLFFEDGDPAKPH